MLAAKEAQNLRAINLLLSNDADVNAKDDNGNTLLMYAAKRGLTDLLHTLIKLKANINHFNKEGKSTLHFAKDDATAKFLLAHGCGTKNSGSKPIIEEFKKDPIKLILNYHTQPKKAAYVLDHIISKKVHSEIKIDYDHFS